MKLKDYLKKEKLNVSDLSKMTGISYMTLSDLCKGKTSLTKTSSENLYRISKVFNISMEDLLTDYLIEERAGFRVPVALIELIKDIQKYDKDDPYGFRIEAVDNLENFSKNFCLDGILTWKQRDILLQEFA